MSILKRMTALAVCFLFASVCWGGVTLEQAHAECAPVVHAVFEANAPEAAVQPTAPVPPAVGNDADISNAIPELETQSSNVLPAEVTANASVNSAGAATPDAGNSNPDLRAAELLQAQQSGDIPDSVTWLDIGTDKNRDAVIRTDGLYYYSDATGEYVKDESYDGLNPNGYALKGTTTNTITVESKEPVTLYLDGVTMTSKRRYPLPEGVSGGEYAYHNDPDSRDSAHPSCIKVSHSDVTIKIKGNNKLTIDGHPNSRDTIGYFFGCAIEKNGMDGSLILETVSGKNDASLVATGMGAHEGALTAAMSEPYLGFANLEIRSGKYTFHSGKHTPGIGANCDAYLAYQRGETNGIVQKTKNIVIKKAEVMAIGGECCAGIGSGYGTPVEGIYISDGAHVTAVGGKLSPGIGSGGMNSTGSPTLPDALDVKDIVISGGDTVVVAYGDQEGGDITPGIGCGSANLPAEFLAANPGVTYNQALENVKATALQNYTDPATGETKSYYGTVQFGSSPTDLINGSENPSVAGSENFIGDYAFAKFLKSQADNNQPVRYVKVFFTPADVIEVTKVPDTSDVSAANKQQLENNATNGSMAGARFGVYTEPACDAQHQLVLGSNVVIITMENGRGSVPVPDGTYYVKEITPPTGFVASDEIRKVVLSEGKVTWYTLDGVELNSTVANEPTYLSVTFVDHDGTQIGEVQSVPYGCGAVAPNNPTWDAHHPFKGWDKAFNYITQDTVVTAQYNLAWFVRFLVDGAQVGETQSVLSGGNATPPAYTPPEGCDWSGWQAAYTNITADTDVPSTTTVKKFTVNFYVDGRLTKTQEGVEYGKAATAPEVTVPEGRAFSGWDKDFSSVKSNLDVRGTTTVATYTVRFYVDDGLVSEQVVAHGSAAADPNYTPPAGRTFDGWDKAFTTITKDTDVFGKTTAKTYTVRFYVDDELISEQVVEYGSGATDPNYTPSEGRMFSGWDKDFSNVTGDMIVSGTTKPAENSTDEAATKPVSPASEVSGSGAPKTGDSLPVALVAVTFAVSLVAVVMARKRLRMR